MELKNIYYDKAISDAEAVSVFVRNWDNLTEQEKNNC